MKLVDLSVPINEQTPVYPGDLAARIVPAGVVARDGYNDHYVSLGTHVGTHIDAPVHMLEQGVSLDQIPIEQFVGRGRCVQVDRQFSLEVIKSVDVEAGDIILFDTGLSAKYHDPVYFENYPAMSAEIANYLVDKKVKMVGFDTCSADNTDEFPIHKILLAGNVLIIENLTNLGELQGKSFIVYALPIKLEIDGAPARVIAEVET